MDLKPSLTTLRNSSGFPKMNIILTLFLLASAVCAKKILIIQDAVGKSHMQFSGTLTDKLVDRGHVVDKLVFRWNPLVTMNGTKKARRIIDVVDHDTPYGRVAHLADPFAHNPKDGFKTFADTRLLFCERTLENKALVEDLRAENYDLAMVTPFEGCGLALTHILGIKSRAVFVATSSADYVFEGLGIPTPPSYISYVFEPVSPGKKLTFSERLSNYVKWFQKNDPQGFWSKYRNLEDPVVQKYYPGTPKYTELFKSVSYVFLNMNELLDIGQPISSKVKFIGGIHVEDGLKKKTKELPQEYEEILSSGPKGTVIFSLGSQVDMNLVPMEIKKALVKAFSHFSDYSFIWKHENPGVASMVNSTNIFFKKWIPQKELLADPRIRCFITHMGLNSYLELAYSGVPTVMLPLFADQEFNAGVAERKGLGVHVKKTKITYQSLLQALHKVLNDPSFNENAKVYAEMLRNQPDKPSETFVRYVEYAAEYPALAEVISLPSTELSFWVFNSYDVLAFFAGCVLFAAVLAALTLRVAFRWLSQYRILRESKKKVE
ncbi:unnamed protein product [Bursaphelenchus xylophilus]|uniref:glucuronosyltransferase n=1 Tax=Bursaphelenchus xylophilus TaxID=6326 RepID=A0A7I8WNE7_BURXY|nr:unnamed protein product [Bursaphelenchus xylophilus]CAG9093144.1 unnamed protein product [Bursaphelenchus xylophilus]